MLVCIRPVLLSNSGSLLFRTWHVLRQARAPDGSRLPMMIYGAHFGVKPSFAQLVNGPFGCLGFMVLTPEQRRARHHGESSTSLPLRQARRLVRRRRTLLSGRPRTPHPLRGRRNHRQANFVS
jgi:hypothetical protein